MLFYDYIYEILCLRGMLARPHWEPDVRLHALWSPLQAECHNGKGRDQWVRAEDLKPDYKQACGRTQRALADT